MAQVFEREHLDRATTYLFAGDPLGTVERDGGFIFVYPGVIYGIDVDRGVVWENPGVPGVDARRVFDLQGRDLEAEAERLRGLVERARRLRG